MVQCHETPGVFLLKDEKRQLPIHSSSQEKVSAHVIGCIDPSIGVVCHLLCRMRLCR